MWLATWPPTTLQRSSLGSKVDDLEELAAKKGLDPAAHVSVVEGCNGFCTNGVDGCSLYRNVYTMNIPGSCCANNINSGRIAARSALARL